MVCIFCKGALKYRRNIPASITSADTYHLLPNHAASHLRRRQASQTPESNMYKIFYIVGLHPQIPSTKLHPQITFTKLHPQITSTKLHPQNSTNCIHKLHPQITSTKLHPQITSTN
jgi:hypothetical protein